VSETTTELSRLGVDALKDLLANLTQAKGFVLEQAPEFCQQIVARGMILPFVAGSVVCLMAVAAGIATYLTVRKAFREEWEDSPKVGTVMIGALAFCGALGAFISGMSSLYCALSVYVAPKVYLVETITRMVR
jgi:hypothetical protein